MSNSEIYTDLPLIAQASGEEITKADETLLEDFSILPANTFIEKYGADTFQSMVNQREATIQAGANALAAGSRGWDQAIQDTAKNIISGAITGVTGAASLVTTPIRPLSEGLARATRGINEFSQSIGSDAEKAQRALHEFKQQGLKARIDREIREAEAGGKSVSLFEKIGKENVGSLVNLFETGQISEIASSGIGSLLVGGPMTKGITKAASFVGSKAPGLANAIDKVAKQNATVAKIKDAAPWMTSMGLQEGGGTYGDMLLKGLDIPTEELMANSPEFQTLYKEYRANGLNHDKAAEEAKRDIAFSAAREAGALTALGAGAANYLTAGLGRGIEKAGLLKSTVSPFIKNADEGLDKFVAESFSEPLEEGISEGLGQFASNLATQRHLDKNQKLDEDIGQSIAEGMAGGLGVTGLRTATQTAPIARKTLDVIGKGLDKGVRASKEAHLDWATSEKRTKAFIKDVKENTAKVEQLGNLPEGTLAPINEKLNSISEEIFNKEKPVSFERSLEIAEEIQNVQKQYEELTRDFKDTEDTKESRKTIKKYDARLKESLSNLSAQFLNPYIKKDLNKQFDPEKDPKTVAEYLIQLEANQPGQGKAIYNRLAPENKEALKKFSFDNLNLDNKLAAITSGSVAQTQTTQPKVTTTKVEQNTQTKSPFTKVEDISELGEVAFKQPIASNSEAGVIQFHTKENTVSLKTKDGTFKLPENVAKNLLAIGSSGDQEKFNSAITSVLQAAVNNNLMRKADTLEEQETPEELNEKAQYRDEDGVIRDFDSEDVNKSLKEKIKGNITNLVKAVKRPLHVWNSIKDPIENFLDILEDDKTLSDFLGNNRFTNTNSLVTALFKDKKGQLDTSKSNSKVFNQFDTLANQLRSMVSEGTVFRKVFDEVIYPEVLKQNGKEPKGFTDNFEDSRELKSIALLATVNFIAKMSKFNVPFNEAFLEKEGINLTYQDADFLPKSAEGVESKLALTSFATDLRKIMGVAQTNTASNKEVDEFFGTLASKLVAGLKKEGLIGIQDLNVKDLVYDPTQKEWVIQTRTLQQITVQEDFRKLFGPKAAIIIELLDPNYKNTIHAKPPRAKNTVAHTDYVVTKQAEETIKKLNATKHTFTTAVGAYASIGGHEGFTELLGNTVNNTTRKQSSYKDYVSKKGQALSRELGFNTVIEALMNKLSGVYFSNVALKNGRYMQEGAATFQNNKVMRSMCTVGEQSCNLKDPEIKDAFYLTLAQNLGESVNKRHFETLDENDAISSKERKEMMDKVDVALNKVREGLNNSKYAFALEALVSTKAQDLVTTDLESTRANREALQDFFQEFGKDTEYSLVGAQPFAALVEMVRYVKADKADTLNNFVPELLCEIDGINDGPSYINAVCTRAYTSFTSDWVRNAAKTGYYIGIDTNSQEMAHPNSDAAKLMEVNHPDFHAEVAYEKVTEYFLRRLIASKNNPLALRTIQSVLTFFKAIGWLKVNPESGIPEDEIIDAAIQLNSLPSLKNYPFLFDREISKKLVTVIPYGSKPKGSMEQVLDLGLKEFYSLMSDVFKANAQNIQDKDSDIKLIEDFQNILEDEEVVIIDTETTSDSEKGPDPSKDEALQIAVIKYNKTTGTKEKRVYFLDKKSNREIQQNFGKGLNKKDNPFFNAYNEAKTNGLTRNQEEVFKELFKFIGNRAIIGQNIEAFDIPLLERQSGRKILNKVLDTRNLSEAILPEYKSHSAEALNDTQSKNAHLADQDVEDNLNLINKMLERADNAKKNIEATLKSSKSSSDTSFNGVSFEDAMKAFETLFAVSYDRDSGRFSENREDIKDYCFSFSKHLPSLEELNKNWLVSKSGILYIPKHPDEKTVRNFYIKTKGIKHLVDVLVPVFGEPAQAAVVDVIGKKGMLAASYPAALMGMLTFLEQGLIKLVTDKKGNGSLENLNQNALHKLRQQGKHLGAHVRLPSGTQAIIRKEGYNEEDALYTDPDTGLSYYPSTPSLNEAGVAGGPLTVQAMGDASMITYLMKTIADIITQVYDGVYSPIYSINNVGLLANKAAYKAQNQKVFAALNDRVNEVGQYLIDVGYAKNSKTPINAIIECLSNLANNKYLDGSKIPNTDTSDNTLLNDIRRYVQSLEDSQDFEPDLDKQAQDRVLANNSKSTYERNVVELIKENVSGLLNQGKLMAMNEQVKLEVLKKIPMTVHHMSASKATYKVGNPISVKDAISLLESVNGMLNLDTKLSWPELMEAYCNAKVLAYVNASKDFTDLEKQNWKEFVGLDKGLDAKSWLPSEVMDLIDSTFQKAEPVSQKVNEVRYQTHNKKAAIKALSILRDKSKGSAIFNTLFGKLLALVPENTKIHVVSHRSGLPGGKLSVNQLGAFKYASDGTPILYILDRDGDLDLFGEKNLETLCHEIIHSVISSMLYDYYADKGTKNLSDVQKQAIENLDKLLDDFLDTSLWEDDGNLPEVVINLRKKLGSIKNPAERLDESLAYIFTNSEIFEYLSTAKFDAGKTHVHHRNWENILSKLIFAAKTLWSRLIGIVSGSRAESIVVNKTERDARYITDYHTFIELYGLNTVGLLNDETSPTNDPEKTKRRQRSLINSDIAPKMLDLGMSLAEKSARGSIDSGRFSEITQNFNKAIKSKAKELFLNLWNKKGVSVLNSAPTKSSAEIEAELQQRVDDYKALIFNLVKDALPNPNAFVDKFVALQMNNAMHPTYRDKLTKVYLQAEPSLSPEMFVDDWNTATTEEQNNAFLLHGILTGQNHLFTEMDVPKDILYPQFKEQAFFFALATTYPGFAEKLKKIKFMPLEPKKKHISDVIGAVEDLSEELTQYWNSKEFNNNSVLDALNIAYGDQQAYNKPQSEKLASSIDIFFGKVDTVLVKGLLFPFALISDKVAHIRDTVGNPNIPGIARHFAVTEFMRKGVNHLNNPLGVEFLKDFYGRTSSNTAVETLLKHIKGYMDKIRKLLLDTIPENLEKGFKRKVSFNLKHFLSKNFGAIDVSAFTFEEIKEFLTKPSAVKAAKARLITQLEIDTPNYVNEYVKRAEDLAKYIMGKEDASEFLLTNAYAISILPQIANLKPDALTEHRIKRLITLFCIEQQNQGDRDLFLDLFTNEEAGMKGVYDQIVEALSLEQARLESSKANERYKFNRIHGWIPGGNRATGHLTIVSKKDFYKSYKSKGYKIVEDYESSTFDKSEPYVIAYCKLPHQVEYQEGILQGINQTGFGYQFSNGTRGEATGTRISDNKATRSILDNLGKKSKGLQPIPVFNEDGLIIGFERSIPKSVRNLLEQDRDLFSGIAQYRSRQEREEEAKNINLQGVELAWQEYSEATDEEKRREFIDVFHTNNLAIKQSVARLPKEVIKTIKSKFGDHLYLRKDEVWTFLGYQRLSLTDMWDNQFILPKAMEDCITKCIDAIASIFGQEGRYFTGILESFLMGTVTWVRDTIIVRSGIVPVMNAIANICLLYTALGIPLSDLIRLFKENAIYTQRYNKLYKRKLDLIYKKANASDSEKRAIEREIERIELEYKNFPIYRLIKDGEYSSISAEGAYYEEIEIFKQKPEKTLNSFIEKYPSSEKVKTFLKEALLTKNSVSYQTLAEFVNQSDWLAKTVAYRYLTEPSKKYKKPMLNHMDARNMASILFVDFDQFVGRERDWTNRIGATWFMTYKYRMIPAAILSLCLNPTRMIFGTCLDAITGLGTPITENLISKLVTGNLANSVGLDMLIRGLILHPLATLMKLV